MLVGLGKLRPSELSLDAVLVVVWPGRMGGGNELSSLLCKGCFCFQAGVPVFISSAVRSILPY